MARTRNLKPGFFTSDQLAECSFPARLLFAGLWTIADRNGRLEDRPKKIKAEIFPHDMLDVNEHLNELAAQKLILRYVFGENQYIQVLKFKEHQNPHQKEPESNIPAPTSPVITGQDQDKPSKVGDKPGLLPSSLPLIPHPEEDTHFAREPFREIYDAGSEAFPALATRNSTVIGQWIEAGVTPEDALPEIARAKAGGVDVKTWKYFSGGVMDSLKTRTSPLPEGQHRGQAPPKKSHMHGIMEAAAKGVQNAERGRE